MVRALRKQDGFTMSEILVTIMIVAILAAVVIPKLGGQQKESKEGAPKATLENAWDITQEYYRGERPDGVLLNETTEDQNSYAGITMTKMEALAPKIDWKVSWATSTTKPPTSDTAVYLQSAGPSTLIVCVSGPTAVLCKGEDGTSKSNKGPRYGASTTSIGDAVNKTCHDDPILALSRSTASCGTTALTAGAAVGS